MKRSCARCLARLRSNPINPLPAGRVLVRPLVTTPLNLARQRQTARASTSVVRHFPPHATPDYIAATSSTSAESSSSAAQAQDDQEYEQPPLLNERYLESWTSIGIPEIIARRLLGAFPHIEAPTPAQRAFLISTFKGKDIYMKDHMGRGKTLAIAIAVSSLAHWYKTRTTANHIQLVVLLPNRHLLHQVEQHLLLLDPSIFHPDYPLLPCEEGLRSLYTIISNRTAQEAESSEGEEEADIAPLLIGTPGDFMAQREKFDISQIKSVIIDEPDTMLPPLPGRHLSTHEVKSHPVNRHPPPLVEAVNHFLGIRTIDPAKKKKKRHWRDEPEPILNVDFSNRRRVQTVWTSGTLDSAMKRFTKTRGWVRKREDLADLNFTSTATPRQVEERRNAIIIEGQAIQVRTQPISTVTGVEPDHYALTVDIESGDMGLVTPESSELVSDPSEDVPLVTEGVLPSAMLEALVTLHTTKPPPAGTYALAICPEGTSIDAVSTAITNMGVPSLYLDSDMLHDVASLEPEDTQAASPILIARRSVVAGLHLPRLHTLYLLGGLGVGDNGRAAAIRDKVAFYEIAAGRVGRLGTTNTEKQRVVSIVTKDSRDEKVMGELFFGKYSVRAGQEMAADMGEKVERRWTLKNWDLEESERILQELYEGSVQVNE